jgi:hypothetical protein
VFAADRQLVWWNSSWAALLGEPSSSTWQLRKFACARFPLHSGPAHLARWPVTEQDSAATDAAVVSDMRRATAASRVARGAAGAVAAHREDRKTIGHRWGRFR